jgi:hypothetical protein
VGSYTDLAGEVLPLAWGWDGTTWSLQAVPLPSGASTGVLSGVSCLSTGVCEAVGYTGPFSGSTDDALAEVWDGTSWSVQATPPETSTSRLRRVSCVASDFCEAVGYLSSTTTLVDTWDGTEWTVQSTAGGGDLSDVSCVSQDFCEAVGGEYGVGGVDGGPLAFAEGWDGTSWTTQSATVTGSTDGSLDGVSCSTSDFCEAVGYNSPSSGGEDTLGEQWDGTGWTVQATPNPASTNYVDLQDVSCLSSDDCEAVGYWTANVLGEATLVEVWDGSEWAVQSSPNVSPTGEYAGYADNDLDGVSCLASGDCEAFGTLKTTSGTPMSLAMGWDGTAWTVQSSSNPAGEVSSSLEEVSCVSSTDCEAVGRYYDDTNALSLPFAESWNGSSWTLQAIPLPADGDGGDLKAVSCGAADFCVAVGYYSLTTNEFGGQASLSEVWNGTSWTLESVPQSVNAHALNSVSCVDSYYCEAVGGTPTGTSIAEVWDGTQWSTQTTAAVSGGMTGVSCAAVNECEAVGYSYARKSRISYDYTLAEKWNGAKWKVQSTPNPSGEDQNEPDGVVCTAKKSCEMVGGSAPGGRKDAGYPLAVVRAGKGWTVQSISGSGRLESVSCTAADDCEAVGTSDGLIPSTATAAAQGWDGSAWTSQTTSSPNGATGDDLYGVSCVAGGGCYAVGTYYSGALYFNLIESYS